jgi:hypothetical protein
LFYKGQYMSIVLVGSTSGSVTLQEPAVAGTTVLTLPAVSGTVLTTASSGQSIPKAALPTGSVLQVVSAVINNNTATTSQGLPGAATGITASITPTSATSKILVMVDTQLTCSATNAGIAILLYRNGSTLIKDAANDIPSRYTTYMYSPTQFWTQQSMIFLDSPASTSSTSYTINISSYTGTNVSLGGGTTKYPSTITLMEIAA